MSDTDTTSELRQDLENFAAHYADYRQGNYDSNHEELDKRIAILMRRIAAQKQRWEAAARISELERLTVKHNKKSVGDTDCSVVNVLLAERIAELHADLDGVIGEPLDDSEVTQ